MRLRDWMKLNKDLMKLKISCKDWMKLKISWKDWMKLNKDLMKWKIKYNQ